MLAPASGDFGEAEQWLRRARPVFEPATDAEGAVERVLSAVQLAGAKIDLAQGGQGRRLTFLVGCQPSQTQRLTQVDLGPVFPAEREIGAADPAQGPYQSVAREQDRELCYRVMEMLAPKKRLVLYLHEIEGKDLKDIAEILGANPVTIRTRLFYARREFYKLVDEEMKRRDAEVEA